jgi:hypothetical protein
MRFYRGYRERDLVIGPAPFAMPTRLDVLVH